MKKTVDGLILRESPVGENDKLLTVLTAKEGKLLMTAKGARSMRSKVGALCRPFTYANIEYYERNDRRWLSGGSVNDSFFGLNSDIEGFALASYILQVADEITGEGVDAEETLRMTLNCLYCIEKKKKPLWQIKAAYELYAVRASGMEPDLSGCCVCQRRDGDVIWLDVMNGRLVCDECMKKRSRGLPVPDVDEYNARNILVPMDVSSVRCAEYVLSADIGRSLAFNLTDRGSIDALCRASEVYLINHLERSFETLDFYRSLKEDI